MPRIRHMLATTGASLLLVALVSATQAQGPGGGGPGGGRGGFGGGFGGPGGGGPGGRGGFGRGGILGLLDYPAVQEEIKLTPDQKKKIDAVKEAVKKKRQALMPARNNNAIAANGGAAGAGAAGNANGGPGGGGPGGGRGNRGNRGGNVPAVDADGNPIPGGIAAGNGGPGGGGGGRGNRGGNGPAVDANGNPIPGNFGGGGPGGRGGFQPTPEMMAAFQELRAYSDSANTNITTKILNKKQVARLQEIDLQRQGPLAVLNDDIALKLNISEDTLAEMRAIQGQSRQARWDAMQAQRQNGPNFQTPDGQFDRAAMQAYRESPEGKAAQAKMQQMGTQMQNDTIAQIGKLLSKNQKAKFKAMQGKDFDLSLLTTQPITPEAAAARGAAAKAAADATPKSATKSTAKKKSTTRRTTTSNP